MVGERRQQVRRMGRFVGMMVTVLALVIALVPLSLDPLPPKAPGIEGREGANAEALALRRQFEALTDEWEVKSLAAGRLAAGDRVAFGVMMGFLDEAEVTRELKRGIDAALLVPGKFTLDRMLEHMGRYPHWRSAARLAQLLGKVARIQCKDGRVPDPRIAPALLQMVNTNLGEGTANIAEAMMGLAELVALGPVEHADLLMADVLDRAMQESAGERDPIVVGTAARVLIANEQEMAVSRLQVRIRGRDPKDTLRREIVRAIEGYDMGRAMAL